MRGSFIDPPHNFKEPAKEPMTDYTDSFRVFDAYAGRLTTREVNQLKAANATSCDFITHVVRPMLHNSTSYISLSEDKQRSRHGDYSAEIARSPSDRDFHLFQFFTNPLLNVAKDDELYNRPSQRVALCDNVVFTFEFDSKEIDFFKQTLSWFRCTKKPTDSAIGRFLAELRADYADCRGLNVTYSGGKSFHLHFVFNTDLLRRHAGPFTSIRDGFEATWLRLCDRISKSPILGIPAGITPDASIRFPDSFRRLPLGMRRVEKEGHFFDAPVGSWVPQAVMWEAIYDRAAKGCANASIFDVADFLQAKQVFRKSRARIKSPAQLLGDSALLDHLTRSIERYFPKGTYPEFHHFGESGGEIAAYFSNSPLDDTPDSIIKMHYSSVFLVGTGADTIETKSLPRDLGDMTEEWTADFDARLNAVDRERTPEEQRFAQAATTHAAAISGIGTILRDKIASAGNHWICAPEGISKSRSLFEATGPAVDDLHEHFLPTATMYAFATYALAKEKCAEFRASQKALHSREGARRNKRKLVPIVLKSFSRAYKDACTALSLRELTIGDAVNGGYNSHIEAITDLQPDALAAVHAYFRRKRSLVTGGVPVIFTVHDVAHEWHKNTHTRRMFSAAFWGADKTNLFNRCREDTALGILIHDEITASNLITMVPQATREWVERLRLDSSAWASSAGSLLDRWTSFNSVSAVSPAPVTFNEASKLAAVTSWDSTVVTAYSGEYGEPREDDIYAATAGNEWSIKRADWFKTARTTIVLTTEAVPTALARHLGDPWVVTELDTPFLNRDTVRTRLFDRLTSAKLADVVATERETYQAATGAELQCISNKAATVAQTTTHKTAKGSNAYIGKPVLQTMVMVPPAQYEIGEVLNALTGRTDMVMLAHLDEFNQSAGRNLGFRFRPGAEHHLVINRRLYLLLANSCLARSRYQMEPVVGRHDRRAASKDKTSPALRALRDKLKQAA